jgi:hypothetical protein
MAKAYSVKDLDGGGDALAKMQLRTVQLKMVNLALPKILNAR